MVVMVALGLSGCAVNFSKRSPWDIQQLTQLSDELEQFKTLAQLKAEEAEQLRQAKSELEQRLSSSEASVGYDERGLVTRMLDSVLFDSGKARLRGGAFPVLDNVAAVLQQVPDQPIGIEGHTDNQPIRRSNWADNTALSIARAKAVAEYLVERHGFESRRLIVSGQGEEQPIASNDTAAGRQKNRRVEIIILPQGSGSSYSARSRRGGSTPYEK
jgi:chemotaxis protein MotB